MNKNFVLYLLWSAVAAAILGGCVGALVWMIYVLGVFS